jgi:hypothetical protein
MDDKRTSDFLQTSNPKMHWQKSKESVDLSDCCDNLTDMALLCRLVNSYRMHDRIMVNIQIDSQSESRMICLVWKKMTDCVLNAFTSRRQCYLTSIKTIPSSYLRSIRWFESNIGTYFHSFTSINAPIILRISSVWALIYAFEVIRSDLALNAFVHRNNFKLTSTSGLNRIELDSIELNRI